MPPNAKGTDGLGKEILQEIEDSKKRANEQLVAQQLSKSQAEKLKKAGIKEFNPLNQSQNSLLAALAKPAINDADIPSELSKRWDTLAALWKRAEDELKHYGIGENVNFQYFEDFDKERNIFESKCLAWAWAKGSWRICHGHAMGDVPSDYDYVPILDSPLSIRQSSFVFYTELRTLVIDKARAAIPKLDKAIAHFSSILNGPQ